MELELTLENAQQLDKELQEIENAIKSVAGDSLIAMAAFTVERQAKINATGRPGPNVQTGFLRASIVTEIQDYDRARVAPLVYYAPFVEFGHIQHPGQFVPPLGKRLVADFCPAYPFLYPAVDQCREQLEGVCVTFGQELQGKWGT